jgi:hypothetical protein
MARILTVLVIAVVLAACPPDNSGPGEPGSYFGTELKLSGDVYTREINFDPESEEDLMGILTGSVNPIAYIKAGNDLNLTISDGGLGGSGEIKNGKLNYFIGAPEGDQLISINEVKSGLLSATTLLPNNVDMPNIEISSNTAQAVFLNLLITNDPVYILVTRENIGFNLQLFMITAETVSYIYVDENVTVTAPGSTNSSFISIPINDETPMNIPVSLTTGIINLNLREGWNSIHSTLIATLSITELGGYRASGNVDIKLNNPSSLKWILSGNNQPIQ